MIRKILQNKKEIIFVFILLCISGLAHGLNMFNFPYYENDEGTYMSRAWSFLTSGDLDSYTYWYDHAPLGWLLISFWVFITGGFSTFVMSVNSGRFLMLILHIASGLLLYLISRNISKSVLPGIITLLFFSLSPLGIYFQRRVLLDNIMIFWVLLSIYLLIKSKIILRKIILSALIFGISILTKENAVFFYPAFVYLIYQNTIVKYRLMYIFKFTFVSFFVVCTYFIYAFLKGELFPKSSESISLFGTLIFHSSRGDFRPFFDPSSEFVRNITEWVERDHLIIIVGILCTIISLLLSIKYKEFRLISFLSILFWIFLARGSLVLNFYIVPLIPLLALNIGHVFNYFLKIFTKNNYILKNIIASILLFSIVISYITGNMRHFTENETDPQIKAYNWLVKNAQKDDFIVIDNYSYVDFRERGFTSTEYAWKVWEDTEIINKLDNNWINIKYILLTHEIVKQMSLRNDDNDLVKKAYEHSSKEVLYSPADKTYLNLDSMISTNGDWAGVYKILDKETIMMTKGWSYFKSSFIKSYGQVIDPSTNNTTSEGQSYALLLSTYLNDKDTFKGVYMWTKDHLQHRTDDKLFSWKWSVSDDKLLDSATASDADIDIALALILAYEKWGDEVYKVEAEKIIEDIWKKEVISVGGAYYLIAGSDMNRDSGYILNPSYISPYHFYIFSKYSNKPWVQLSNDSIILLNSLSNSKTGLIPNWVYLNNDGEISTANKYSLGEPDNYGFDAFRVYWRIALFDKLKNIDSDSLAFTKKAYQFFSDKKESKINAVYSLEGVPQVDYSTLATDTAFLSLASMISPNDFKQYYKDNILSKFDLESGYIPGSNGYYDQSWFLLTSILLYSSK